MAIPKVISLFEQTSFESLFPDFKVLGKTYDVFIECQSYDIHIPLRSKIITELNIFELTILRLINRIGSSAADINNLTCLREDFILNIMQRLLHLGLLDKDMKLTAQGLSKIEQHQAHDGEEDTKYELARAFLIKATGELLPYIQIGEPNFARISNTSADSLTMNFGTAGKSVNVTGYRLSHKYIETPAPALLPEHKLRATITMLNRKLRSLNKKPFNVSATKSITSHVNEPVYFHFKALVQDGNADQLLFSDGLRENIDFVFDYVATFDGAIDHIRQNILSASFNEQSAHETKPTKKIAYADIHGLIYDAQSKLPNKAYEDASNDERKLMKAHEADVVKICYSLVEKALLHMLKEQHLSEELLNTLTNQNAKDNGALIIQMAHSLGLKDLDKSTHLLERLNGSKIASLFEDGMATMQLCLPLAIAQANQSENSPMRSLIASDPYILKFIQRLANIAAPVRHDSESAIALDNVDAKQIFNKTKNVVATLLPNINLDCNAAAPGISTNLSSERLQANLSLSKAFGGALFNQLSEGLRNDFIRISPDKSDSQLPNLNEYAQILYRIMQTVLSQENKHLSDMQVTNRSDALNYLASLTDKEHPDSLKTVSIEYFNKALRNGRSSLGAETLVFAANQDEELVKKLIAKDFIALIDKILVLRGHGNQSAEFTESALTMGQLRDQCIDIIKLIGK